MERPKCAFNGCNNIAEKQQTNGKISYRNYCSSHRKKHFEDKQRKPGKMGGYGPRNGEHYSKIPFHKRHPAIKCSLCSWDGPCDRHRIKMGKEGGQYVEGNVLILCPNCHRLVHTGKLILK